MLDTFDHQAQELQPEMLCGVKPAPQGNDLDFHERVRRHTIPFLMTLLNCNEEKASNVRLTWQTFNDDKDQRDSNLTHLLHGTLNDLVDLLEELNQAGAGIFVTINKTNLKGRSKGNIASFRGLWADLDTKLAGGAFSPDTLPCPPSMVVQSGHGSHHYWCLQEKVDANPESISKHESILRGIQKVLEPYGADPQVCEVSRVMRIPGFYNKKKVPYPLVQLVHHNAAVRYRMTDLADAFPPVTKGVEADKKGPCKGVSSTTVVGVLDSTEVERGEVLRLAGEYLESCGPAISGDCGHQTTFVNALKVISGFDLTVKEAFEQLRDHYNPRCEPPWSEAELIHKVEDAHRVAQDNPKRGWLLRRCLRPTILIGSEHQVVEDSIKALAPHGEVFSRRGSLVRVLEGVPGGMTPSIEPVNEHWLRDILSDRAFFCRINETTGQPGRKTVPEWCPKMILARKKWDGFDELNALVETPVYLSNGKVLAEPGFDEESGVYVTEPKVAYPHVPTKPTRVEALVALKELWDIVEDFPFAMEPSPECHRAAWLALVMTMVARFAIKGPVPFGLIDASVAGSGKGMLTKVSLLIALGRIVPTMSCVADEEELRKRILPPLMYGDRAAWVDDAPSPFGGNTWNALITSWPEYRDRILGKSESITVPADTTWVVTGNNLTLKGDSTRRALHIRLEPRVEHPEERDDFSIVDLVSHVEQNHPRLLVAVLTILSAYHLAGSPSSGLAPLGSFEAWCRMVRDCVYWITGEDVCQTQRALGAVVDENRATEAALLKGMYLLVGDKAFTSQDLMTKLLAASQEPGDVALQTRDAADQLKRGTQELSPRSLGRILSGLRGRIIDHYQLQVALDRPQGKAYRVVHQEEDQAVKVSEVSEVSLPRRGEESGGAWRNQLDRWSEAADDSEEIFPLEEEIKPQKPQKPHGAPPSQPGPSSQQHNLPEPSRTPAATLVSTIPTPEPTVAPEDNSSWLWDDKEEDRRLKGLIHSSILRA